MLREGWERDDPEPLPRELSEFELRELPLEWLEEPLEWVELR